MGLVDKKKKGKPFVKPKLVIQFDEEARKEYLTGFQKRKKERRAKAVKDAEGKLKQARQERRAEIRERVRQLRELNEIGEGAAEKEGEADDVADEQEEQHAEVQQYSDGENEITVVTTAEVTPFSLTGDANDNADEGSDNDDPLARESAKRQKVQDAMLELKMLKKKPLPALPKSIALQNKKARGGHFDRKGGAAHGAKRAGKQGRGRGKGKGADAETASGGSGKKHKGAHRGKGKRRG